MKALLCLTLPGLVYTLSSQSIGVTNANILQTQGNTIESRFTPPASFYRLDVPANSFALYLRNLPLRPAGSPVKYFNGQIKSKRVHEAVLDIDVGNKDLQQCADAIMRLRAEYLYSIKAYQHIAFTLTNGFKVEYSEWMMGKRIVVKGNKTSWVKSKAPANTYTEFRKYMTMVFMYAGTLSLAKELNRTQLKDLAIGHVFIEGGAPGHAVIVVDIAEDQDGNKLFMLAQSYMPAQDIHVLKNIQDPTISPWYRLDNLTKLATPEWTFKAEHLKTW